MELDTKYTNLDSTSAMTAYVEEKMGALDKLVEKWNAEGGVAAHVEIARTTHHHHKGPVFRAEINLHLPHVILRAEHIDVDARVAVDLVRDKVRREIIKYKETLNSKL